ncbi:hypothetical protein ALC60_13088 [Trachymyrmex zeteki]|uniref:DUF7041 domain-containing protein n=1 Tax=Mycetomoellerius zeteki TaxID=64791 RepID=A0A151WJ34_9HYME|nr:hypothetical protein ALC60_13088 [Trachymyrmex zeteki]
MPVDRTPVKSFESPVTSPGDGEVPSFSGIELRGDNLSNAEPPQSGESRQIHSNEFRLIKLPTFWHKHPKLWFAQLESEFLVYRIRSEEIKFSSVLRHLRLDEQALLTISDIIENAPEKDKCITLKTALINCFTDFEEKRLRQLLPSDLLREIKQLSGGAIVDNILHSIWLQRLPLRVQATLAVVEDVPLIKLAELADRILERDNS